MGEDRIGDSLFPGARRARSYGDEETAGDLSGGDASVAGTGSGAPSSVVAPTSPVLPPPPAIVVPPPPMVVVEQQPESGRPDKRGESDSRGTLVDLPQSSLKPATWGWRGRLNRWSGAVARLPPSAAERRYRAERVAVLHTFGATQRVFVANPKGAAGKTLVTLGLAATFGRYRGGYTLAWDNNETRGTLGLLAEPGADEYNVVDLLAAIGEFVDTRASVGGLGRFVRPQSAHFDVLASDDVPGRLDIIDGGAVVRLVDVLSRFYRCIVIDTGNNARAPNWLAASVAADCLVVPTTVRADAAETGLWMLHHLIRLGRGALVRDAVAVVTCADPRVDEGLLSAIVDRYREVVRAVVVLPYDPVMDTGGPVSYRDLSWDLRRALLTAAVEVVTSMARKADEGGRRG
ncbi:MinD/ParA family protein [Micromonospora chokoriensis]